MDSGGMTLMETQHIVVAGAGGNIGSHLLPHLARMPRVARLTLVDPDIYTAENLQSQNIDSLNLARPKVVAQASVLRKINPSLEVAALRERIEDVSRGLLQCDLFVSSLDSRAARQRVNEIAWRLKTPWVDCGVLGSQNLARVNAYMPAEDAACLECLWGEEDYAQIEQEYLCSSGGGSAYPTMASSALGALAASLTALEIVKLFAGDLADSVVSKQVLVDAQHHVMQVTQSRRNPACRFDHHSWVVEPWHHQVSTTTIGATLNAIGSVAIEGHRFVQELVCPGCSLQMKTLQLNRPLAHCPKCNRRMVSRGFGSLERLDCGLAEEHRGLTLAQIGLGVGDIISSSGNRHYRISEAV
jgi:molybdopterin/thiamine biosynthesis adenylyltransferase